MNSRRIRYSSMRSLSELQAERAKLNTLKKINEIELLDDADAIKQSLDPTRLAARALAKAYVAYPVVGRVVDGYRYVTAFTAGLFSKKGCGCR